MPKNEYNKIKSLTKDQFYAYFRTIDKIEECEDEEPYVSVRDFGIELYEFGKYCDFVFPKHSFLSFFKKKEMKDRFYECDLKVVKPEFLESIIEHYRKKIADNYNEMIAPFLGTPSDEWARDKPSDFLNSIKTEYNFPNNKHTFDFSKITEEEQNKLFDIIEHIRAFRIEWVHLKPYNLHDNSQVITKSWKYEYGLFELVRIYKSFDWKRNVMFYCGF